MVAKVFNIYIYIYIFLWLRIGMSKEVTIRLYEILILRCDSEHFINVFGIFMTCFTVLQ